MEKQKNATGCSGCSCCTMRADVGEPRISGFRLGICAFLVFVLPLLTTAIAAGISYQRYQCPIWATVLIAAATAAITILIVRFITKRIQPDHAVPPKLCGK